MGGMWPLVGIRIPIIEAAVCKIQSKIDHAGLSGTVSIGIDERRLFLRAD
jgi:hypothetical protein